MCIWSAGHCKRSIGFENIYSYDTDTIGLTRAGALLTSQGIGNYQDWKNISVCNESVKEYRLDGSVEGNGIWADADANSQISLSDEEKSWLLLIQNMGALCAVDGVVKFAVLDSGRKFGRSAFVFDSLMNL